MPTIAGPEYITLLDIDLTVPTLHLGIVQANDRLVSNDEVMTSMANRSGALVGINGDFFEIGGSGRPIGMVETNGRLVQSPAVYAVLQQLSDGRAIMGYASEPNYLWLEGGTNFGIYDDNPPTVNHIASGQHLVTLLKNAGISWKAYQESISGTVCPLYGTNVYAPKHNPMIFFNDVTGNNNLYSPYCIAHERPYSEFATNLKQNSVARYNFITPNVCNDMHDACAPTYNAIQAGDSWLAQQVPLILASQAYKNGGMLFITWDEGEGGDGPIGLIALSPYTKGKGYSNTLHYTHSSLLRTIEEVLGVSPLLGDAAHANDLRDLFKTFPW